MLNENGETVTVQKRHLMSIMEADSIWKSENPKLVAGKSKFASLCPKNVLLTSKLQQNVCVFIYHEHFISAFIDFSPLI